MKKTPQVDITKVIKDRYTARMNKLHKVVKHLKYNRDAAWGKPGSYIIINGHGIVEASRILTIHMINIYIHQKYGSAVFYYDSLEQKFIGELWHEEELEKAIELTDIEGLKNWMKKFWDYCKYKRKWAED